mmetsp:Transcript_6727/g.13825  ORF Transcript_6727/g.13825 Transcript_6727/m.13825 type:complete len:304 (-) Transcript_6727:360-1271(-)|eukprot:CAMPEP_0182541566 /NCGR_PEP_ID=MMETSP1323-20130603/28826_1 /TAXON_ID=236787 /ORGANISM="Florenciella parvula, Strain RCC1693" /LENGTH=303 /DNA_ID=CAMNT_0024752329 /DNA_START=39 /DNA_END=950 /DNA_ORIENTATION=-
MALTSRPSDQVWGWATFNDMPKYCLFSYWASLFCLVYGFISVWTFIYYFNTYTDEETFFGIHGYGNVKLLIGSVSVAAIAMNTVLLNVETSISREFKQYTHGRIFRSIAEPIYKSTIPASFFTEGVYYSWMIFYLAISLIMLILITIFFLYWVLIFCMRKTCLGQKGNAAEFVDLVAEASSNFDDKMTAAHFCDMKDTIITTTVKCLILYIVAFLMQVNLMGVIVVQQYRLRHSGDLVPLIAPRNILLEPVGHFDSDGHMDHKSIHDDLNEALEAEHKEEVEQALGLGNDEKGANNDAAVGAI